jgi:hypothetical protein
MATKIIKLSQLSPHEQDKERLLYLRNRINSGFNFGRLKTLLDFLYELGHSKGELQYAYGVDLKTLQSTPLTKDLLKSLLDTESWQVESTERARQYDQMHTTMVAKLPDIPEVTSEAKESNGNPSVEKNILPSSWTQASQHPKQKAKLWKKQELAAAQIYEKIVSGGQGILLNAATGAGKTFVLGAVIRRLIDNHWKPLEDCCSPWPIVYVTKASIVEQSRRVLERFFGIDCRTEVTVINIEQLRATFGDRFIKWETLIENGEEFIRPIWKPNIHPILFIWDECHILKNLDSQQSLIAQDVNNIQDRYDEKVFQIFSSATAGTRVIEFKCFAVSTHASIADRHSVTGRAALTNRNWTAFAKNIAHPQDPEEHSPAAIEKLITHLLDYIVDIKGLRPQFHPTNRVEMIEFETPEEQKRYQDAWEDYQKKKLEFENSDLLTEGQSRMMILAQFTIFRKMAEAIRARTIARRLHHMVQEGSASVAACCFKGTIANAVQILVDDYNVPRNKISIIWGGLGNEAKKVKKEVVEKIKKQQGMTEEERETFIRGMILAGCDMKEIEEMIELQDELAGDKPEVDKKAGVRASDHGLSKQQIDRYGLGAQSKIQRQGEIDRFQSGQSLYCFFTFKAGGVGLSLHHSDELTTFKCRKHPNGDWSNENDISKVPTCPRFVLLTPVYSAIELVQGLGRCARLTSLSDTPQTVLFYRGTIEERVAHTVSIKLKCLKKVVRQRESWESVILNPDKLTEEVEEIPQDQVVKPIQQEQQDPDDDVFLGGSSDVEEED